VRWLGDAILRREDRNRTAHGAALLRSTAYCLPARVNLWCPAGDQVQAAAGVVNVPWSE
jgi:hypothetical protein